MQKDKNQRHEPHIEALLRYANNIISTLREPFLVLDKNLKVISANQAFYTTFKVVEKETMGRLLPDLGNKQWNISKLLLLLKDILPEKKALEDYEVVHKFEQIGERTMVLNACQVRVPKKIAGIIAAGAREEEDEEEEEELILLAIEDATERKHLWVEEHRYRTLIDNLPQKVFLKDRNSVYISCNKNYAKDLKIKPEEIAGKTDHDFFPTHLAQKYRADDKRVMESGQTETIEEEFVIIKDFLRGAQKTFINTVKVPVRDKNGNVTGIFGLFWDITRRKTAELNLIDSERKFRAIFDNAGDGILLANPEDQRFYMGNNTICRMLGYGPDEISRLRITDIHPEEDLPHVMDQFEKQTRGEIVLAGNLPVKRKDGSVFRADVNATTVEISGKKYLMGFFHDITDHKKMEEELKESACKIRAIFDQTFQFIGMMTVEGVLIEANLAALDFADIKKADVINKPFWETPWWTHSPELQEKLRQAVKTAAGGEVVRFEATHVAKDGSLHNVDFSLKPVKDGNGNVTFIIPEGRDITDRKRLEDELRKAEVLKNTTEIKSKFASMVSHEFRSPMAVIKESINLVLEGLVGSVTPEQKDILNTAKSNIDRLSRLINNVLDFQKIESGKMGLYIKEHDLNEVVLATSKEMNLLAEEKGLGFTVNIDESMPAIRFDKDRIVQVLTNLLSNAIKFTEKGAIIVSTEREDNMAHVMVEDTGAGIHVEDMSKLFQTFEQLGGGMGKRRGGTGLGLAISKDIILTHNGKIWAESQFGKGSTFHFTLPIKERRARG